MLAKYYLFVTDIIIIAPASVERDHIVDQTSKRIDIDLACGLISFHQFWSHSMNDE